jgi:hypothetical protein
MSASSWRKSILASVIWAIAGLNAGFFLAVAPATSAYKECIKEKQHSEQECDEALHRDWPHYSGERIPFAISIAIAPLVVAWSIGWALSRRSYKVGRDNEGRPHNEKSLLNPVKPSN